MIRQQSGVNCLLVRSRALDCSTVPLRPDPCHIFPHKFYLCFSRVSTAFAVRELSALHTKRLMVTFDESEAERERDVEDSTREVTPNPNALLRISRLLLCARHYCFSLVDLNVDRAL